jgi:hypothetical protein
VYIYESKYYGASMGRGVVEIVSPFKIKDFGRLVLSYSLEEIRSSDQLLTSNGNAIPAATEESREIHYGRGSIEETYVLKENGLEQLFVIRELPERRGAIKVTGKVSSNLKGPPEGTTSEKLIFRDPAAGEISISDAVASDSTGRRLSLMLAYSQGRVSMTIPEDWVTEATLPIVIDPLVGGIIAIGTDSPDTTTPPLGVAFNSTLSVWMVLWNGVNTGSLFAHQVDSSGNLLGSQISIATKAATPAISYAATSDKYLIVWSDEYSFVIYGCILASNGSISVPKFTISSMGGLPLSCASDGSGWMLTSGHSGVLSGIFVSSSGAVGSTIKIANGSPGPVAFAAGLYFVSYVDSVNQVTTATTINPTTHAVSTPVTVDSTGLGQCSNLGVSANPISPTTAQFLVTWDVLGSSTNYLNGRIVNASLGFDTPMFTIASGPETGFSPNIKSAFSTGSNVWYTVYVDPTGSQNVLGAQVTTSGSVSAPADTISGAVATNYWVTLDLEWNPGINQALIVYGYRSNLTTGTYSVVGQLFGLPLAAPPAPTGLTAKAGNSQVSLTWSAASGAANYEVDRATASSGPYTAIAFPTGTSFTDFHVINGTQYFYEVASFGSLGSSSFAGPVSATPAAPTSSSFSALFVVGNTTLNSGDMSIKNHLQSLGYSVAVKGDAATVSGDASGKAMVVISATVNSANVNTKFTNASVPVLNLAPNLMNPLGMTGQTSGTNFGTISSQTQVSMVSTSASSSMAAGLPGNVTVLSKADTFTFGQPNSNATIVATLPTDSTKALIWSYEVGDSMPGLTAPGRRVGFFLNVTTASNLNANGGKLLDAALLYCAGAPTSPGVVSAQPTSNGMTISWDPGSGALSFSVYRSTTAPTPGHLGTLLAKGLTVATYVDTTAQIGQIYYYSVVPMNTSGVAPPATTSILQNVVGTTVVSVLGPKYLRRLPPPPANPLYCTADYQAFVKYTDANRVVTVLSQIPDFDTTNPMWEWQNNPNSIGGLTANLIRMSLSATQNTGDGIVVAQFLPNRTRFPNSPRGGIPITVKSRRKTTVSVWAKFPGNTHGRTTRTVRNPNGGPNINPFDTNSDGSLTANAQNARGIIAGQIQSGLQQYWGQGLIDFYVEADLTIPTDPNMQIPGFNPNGQYDTGTRAQATAAYVNLNALPQFHTPNSINVWLIQGILNGDSGNALSTGQTILVADAAINDFGRVVSHEFGHTLGLDDEEDFPSIDGTLNNTTPFEGLAAARTRLLMLHAGCQNFPDGGWLTEREVSGARVIVNTLQPRYPALRDIEPPP